MDLQVSGGLFPHCSSLPIEFQIENFPFFVNIFQKDFVGKKTKVFFLFEVPGNSLLIFSSFKTVIHHSFPKVP